MPVVLNCLHGLLTSNVKGSPKMMPSRKEQYQKMPPSSIPNVGFGFSPRDLTEEATSSSIDVAEEHDAKGCAIAASTDFVPGRAFCPKPTITAMYLAPWTAQRSCVDRVCRTPNTWWLARAAGRSALLVEHRRAVVAQPHASCDGQASARPPHLGA